MIKNAYELEVDLDVEDQKQAEFYLAASHGGTFGGFLGTGMDVTEQERSTEEVSLSERRLREKERELRQILDLTPQHLGVLGPEGSPLYANRAALDYFDVDMDQWRASSRIDLVHPGDREHFLAERQTRFLEGAAHEFEARMRRHDGEFLIGDGHAGAIYNATGPERLSRAERTGLVAEISGRQFVFQVIAEEQLRAGLEQAGVPAAGAFDIASGDVESLGGRPPKPLRDILAEALKSPSA